VIFNPLDPNLFDDEHSDYPGSVCCKFCGYGPFEWQEARGEKNRKRWVLVDVAGNIHDCRSVAGPDEFPLIRKRNS
jgi:hypothetical protein